MGILLSINYIVENNHIYELINIGNNTPLKLIDLVKEIEVPSGHNSDLYLVERFKAKSHDGRMIPITLVRKKETSFEKAHKKKSASIHFF